MTETVQVDETMVELVIQAEQILMIDDVGPSSFSQVPDTSLILTP